MRAGPAAVLALALTGAAGAAQQVDVNVLTGLDVSDSVGGAELRAHVAGLEAAIRSPEVLEAIGRGTGASASPSSPGTTGTSPSSSPGARSARRAGAEPPAF